MVSEGEAIPLENRAAWDDAVARLPHAFGHTWDSCHAMQQTTGRPTFLFRYRSGTAECVCPFMVRSFQGYDDIFTPYGFSGLTGAGDGAEMVEALRGFAAERGYVCGYIGLNPLLAPEAFLSLPECRSDNDAFFLELAPEPDALLAAMSRGRRRQILRWEEHGGPLLDDQAALAGFFCANLVPFLRSRDAAEVYDFAPETLRLLVSAPSTFLLGAGTPDAVEAATLFASSPTIGEHMFIVTRPGCEHHAVPLTWAGAMALRERGVRWLSMGGGITRGDSVAQLKERFGAQRLPLPVLRQVYDAPIYDRLCRLTGGDCGDASGYFPAYHWRPVDVS